MNPARTTAASRQRGYLLVLFVLILAFVGVAVSMQVLVLTSVATTSRAYDSYRQSTAELARLERATTEALLDMCQISAAPQAPDLRNAVDARVASLCTNPVTVTSVPASLPAIRMFPDSASAPDSLGAATALLGPLLTPELAVLVGPHAAVYPTGAFEFASTWTVRGVSRSHRCRVDATLIAVPLTRFPVVAYDLPTDIGNASAFTVTGPVSAQPAGLVPGRDPAFLTDLQAHAGTLPYHYRRRAALAAAYQYVFSQAFADRVAEYAGVTHYHALDASSGTAVLAGMSTAGAVTSWDLGAAGNGTFGTITTGRDAAVIFTSTAGKTLRLFDSGTAGAAPALLLLVQGPAVATTGPLDVQVESISRPVVIVGSNIRVRATQAAVNGALLLDPTSSMVAGSTLSVGHFSYWAGSTGVSSAAVTARELPAAAELLAPRVVYAATAASRL